MARCAACASDSPEGASFCRHCGSELSRRDPLLGQEVLGRYRITRLIGEGGMGRVYEAEQRVGTTTRRVAVKTLRPQLCADPQVARRFFREAETIVRLSHPNLIQFFDFGELTDGMLAMVMEFIEGQSLAQLLSTGPLEPARMDLIFGQICGALAEAHGLGIVHRDLKPDNILLTRRAGHADFVKVLDFGIAQISASDDDRSTKLTQQGMMVGTPPYMSPEQFSGEAVDARSDIYSLGIIAYEMLTGSLPFDARTPWEWASKHLTAEPAPLRTPTTSGLAERRGRAIRRALSKRPEQRQQHVGELLAEFAERSAIAAELALVPAPGASGAQLAAASVVRTPPATHGKKVVNAQGTPLESEAVRLSQVPGSRSPVWIVSLTMILGASAAGGWIWLRGPAAEGAVDDGTSSPALPPALPAAEPVSSLPSSSGPAVAASNEGRGGARPLPAERRASAAAASRGEQAAQRPEPTPSQKVPPQPAAPRPEPQGFPKPRGQEAASTAKVTPPSSALGSVPSNPVPPQPPAASPPSLARVDPAAAADLQARVDRALAMAPQRVEVAVGLYQAAAARYGAEQPALVPLRRALAQHGELRIRALIEAGRCAQAQAIYRALYAAHVESGARRSFGSSCPAP
jgi:serine/threonine protein kinase